VEYLREKQPLVGGVLEVDDTVATALHLLSDAARHVTGHCLAVDGGALAR